MRKDIYKVVHETTRSAGTTRVGRPYRVVDGESLAPTRESMRRVHRLHYRGKTSRLNLAPLKRFVDSRVGQPWDKVYAELCQGFAKRDSELTDPMRYLDIETNTSMLNDEVVVHSSFGGVHSIGTSGYSCTHYVHPLTGLLCATNRTAQNAIQRREWADAKEAEKLAHRRVVDTKTQLHLRDGQWYEVTMGTLPDAATMAAYLKLDWKDQSRQRASVRRFDVLLCTNVGANDNYLLREYYGASNVFAKTKRQLSHRELKVHGLLPALAV